MNTLVMGTTNPAKIAQIRDALALIGISVTGVVDKNTLPHVEEDGATVQENARKKASTYAKALGVRVLSMDNALFLDGLSPDRQPGVHVRRIGGHDAATDAELLDHGVVLIESLGGRATGHWEFGVCVAYPDGTFYETTIITPRIFTSTPSGKVIVGYPLESIQIDPRTNKYISEMTNDEKAEFWQRMVGEPLCEFVRNLE